jgi:hypothetical protein
VIISCTKRENFAADLHRFSSDMMSSVGNKLGQIEVEVWKSKFDESDELEEVCKSRSRRWELLLADWNQFA